MHPLRLRPEHSGLLLGIVLAGLLLGAWTAGVLGPAASPARARGDLRLSRYQAAGPVLAPAGGKVAPVPPASADPQTVLGAPSLSAALIDTILGEYGSPAQGQGAAFVALGRQYSIDPAFALAFYVHESHCGTRGVARFTHGIGNIRWTPGFASYEGYRSYPTFAAGIEDWFKLIRELYVDGWGLRTVAAIVPRYAPYGDNNNPPVYIANVESLVAGWRARAAGEQ